MVGALGGVTCGADEGHMRRARSELGLQCGQLAHVCRLQAGRGARVRAVEAQAPADVSSGSAGQQLEVVLTAQCGQPACQLAHVCQLQAGPGAQVRAVEAQTPA